MPIEDSSAPSRPSATAPRPAAPGELAPHEAVYHEIATKTHDLRKRIASMPATRAVLENRASPSVQLAFALVTSQVHECYETAISRTAWWHRDLSRDNAITEDIDHWKRTVEIVGGEIPTLNTEPPTWLKHLGLPTLAGALFVIEGARRDAEKFAIHAKTNGPEGWQYHLSGLEHFERAESILSSALKKVAAAPHAIEACVIVATKLLEYIESALTDAVSQVESESKLDVQS